MRCSLEFASWEELAACLEAIGEDSELVVCSSLDRKMRLRESHDATASGGYRDVQLSVRFESAEARERGVHLHVAEVQLHHEALFQMKHDGGHRLYVQSRNIRGE